MTSPLLDNTTQLMNDPLILIYCALSKFTPIIIFFILLQSVNSFNGAISTTVSPTPEYEYEYEYYYDDDDEYYEEDEDYLLPPPPPPSRGASPTSLGVIPPSLGAIPTDDDPFAISTQAPNLVSQIPLVSSPIPQPVTLANRPTTISDPKLPPIPTFSPKQIRNNRIKSHRLAKIPKNFPIFNNNNNNKLQQQEGNLENFKISSDGRKPRVKSNLKQAERNRGNNRFSKNFDPPQQQQQQQQEKPKFSTDGRKPRVKSNLKQAERDRGNNRFSKNEFRRKILRNRQRFDTVDFEENSKNSAVVSTTTTARSPVVNFQQNTEEPEITTNRPNFNFADLFSSDLVVKPDGRTPRVKSNIKQKKANNGRPFAKSHKIPVPSDLFEPKFHEERSISEPISSQNLLTDSSRNVSQSVSQKNELLQHVDNEILPPSKAEKQKQNNQNNLLAELGKFFSKKCIKKIILVTQAL